MSRGHGMMINMTSFLPFIFTYNPSEINTKKPINYFKSPNIGGAFHELFFIGFDNTTVSFDLMLLDMESPIGVKPAISWFEQLRKPAPGILGLANTFKGNANYPPPQVLFQFGVSMVPLIWNISSVDITPSNFSLDDHIRGVIGVPRQADISIELILDEDSTLYRAESIAEQASSIIGSVESITREVLHKATGSRKEMPGIL